MSGVRNKIASFEAHNKQLQASSPSRNRLVNVEMSPARSTSTARAAQNRVSRMKQEVQMTKDGKTLVDKRKLLKERRMLQQRRASTPDDYNPLSIENRVILPRRTECRPDENKPAEEMDKKESSSQVQMQAMSPGRHSRLSKVQQRMQKIKGSDQSKKKVTTSRPSNAASTTESTATTTVAQNSTRKPLQRRQRQANNLMQSRAKRVSDIKQNRNLLRSPDAGTNSGKPSTEDSGSSPPRPYLEHRSGRSPTSDVDMFSDNNYAYGPTDQSVEATDDEATLTSVRRIMAGENNGPSPRDKSVHYHHLQTFEDSNRGGRTIAQSSHSRSGHAKLSRPHSSGRMDDWPQEEKSDKTGMPRVFRVDSSSDYDTDGDMSKNSRQSQLLDGPSHSQVTDVNEFFTQSKYPPPNRRMDDDERTFDYGDRDDASNASGSHAMRQRRILDPPQEALSSNDWKESKEGHPSSLINKDDVEHYTKSFGSPAMKVGVGVIGAVTIGCIVLGPASLLAGAAVVGLGVGVMQIPEQERQRIQAKVEKTVRKVHAKAVDATETLSHSCVTTYEESGVAEHLPPCLSLPTDNGAKDNESTRSDKRIPGRVADESKVQSTSGQTTPGAPPVSLEPSHPRSEHASSVDRPRNKKVACLRNVRILPPGQIHGLDPGAQPKAWLDVVASANTSEDEKAEAMEEILILAKDKRRARIFLEEGILDSLIWTLDRYFEKQQAREKDSTDIIFSRNERRAVKLAATCCLTLGKSHCAAIHTEGDLQLMSLYERGTVPEERQVAQMLYEIPHHVRITKVIDPTIIDPSKEVFALRQLSLQQAEDLARSIQSVMDGQLP